ncbi:MAG TPA: hypothetical protein VER32_00815 [Pyrinomonadaceae bacterium]|nr:hypothetical protein [Pyrinomonadaceae bacterium]
MSRHVGFALLVAVTLVVFIAGPLKHLRSGTVEYRRTSYPQGRRLLRRDEPLKFHAYVALEILFLALGLATAYWVILVKRAG